MVGDEGGVETVAVDEALVVVDGEVGTHAFDIVEVADGEVEVVKEEEDGVGFDAVDFGDGEVVRPAVFATVVELPVGGDGVADDDDGDEAAELATGDGGEETKGVDEQAAPMASHMAMMP